MNYYIWGMGNEMLRVAGRGMSGHFLGFISDQGERSYQKYPVHYTKDVNKQCDFIFILDSNHSAIADKCKHYGIPLEKLVYFRKESINLSEYVLQHLPSIRSILGEESYNEFCINHNLIQNSFFMDDLKKYEALNTRPEYKIDYNRLWPILTDKYANCGSMDDYFWQDLWGAKHVIQSGVKVHTDIGSSLAGFIAHVLASGIQVTMIDVRPFPGEVEGLTGIVDDATMMNNIEDNSLESLSALCSLEHFGLGRYGDPIDPEACFKCFEQISKKMKQGGKLYISLPVGQDYLMFNAHRVYHPRSVCKYFSDFELKEFSYTTGGKIFYNAKMDLFDHITQGYATGLFYFEKK